MDERERFEERDGQDFDSGGGARNNDDVNSTRAIGDDNEKEDAIDMKVIKNLLYKLLSLLAATGSQMHVIGEA